MGYTNTFLSQVKDHFKKECPFVVYREPNQDQIHVIYQDSTTITTNKDFNEEGFVFSPFEKSENNQEIWFLNKESVCFSYPSLDISFDKNISDFGYNLETKTKHIKLVDQAIDLLQNRSLDKVVVSRKESISISTVDPFAYFEKINTLYKNAFCYLWYHPKVGMWLGATPETLIEVSGGYFKTMGLAGTQPYVNTLNVNWGDKEIEEQQYVVDCIYRALKGQVDNLQVGERKTHKAGSLLHLKTDISGNFTTQNQLKVLVEVLHPTPAVCGLPKTKSKEFILKNEFYDREYYTGFLGNFSKEKTALFVNLRCMKIDSNRVHLFIGGGITASSNSSNEWQETINKSKILKVVL